MSKTPAMMRGKYIVYFVVALAVVLAAYLLIFKPGPMSAEKVAHAKQRAIYGEESDFKFSEQELAAMPEEEVDSVIVLFNEIIRAQDSLDLANAQLTSSTIDSTNPTDRRWTFVDVGRLRERKKVATAYIDLMAGELVDTTLVDSLAALASRPDPAPTKGVLDSIRTAAPGEFELMHSRLYGDQE